ncbi:MAG: VacJ family lipoprotein [Phenylobacterium sp.]|nr:VacJ family lipoprotein [Phenylobacterium sp.]
MNTGRPGLTRVLLMLSGGFTLGFAASPARAQIAPYDPWERTNRRLYAFEDVLDRNAIGPAARTYARAPAPLRKGVKNFGANLGEPVVFVNDALQGRPGPAATTLGRFAINSIFGLLGLFDVATRGRVPHHDNSFADTLGRWGAKPGPYLFLPLVGPSTVRDAFGGVVNVAVNPLTYVDYQGKTAVGATVTLTQGLQRRADADQELRTVQETSTDPYATIRSYYLQSREAQVSGRTVDIETLPDFDAPAGPGPRPARGRGPNPSLSPPSIASPSDAPPTAGPPTEDAPRPSPPGGTPP